MFQIVTEYESFKKSESHSFKDKIDMTDTDK